MSGCRCFPLWTAPRVIDETGAYAVVYKPPLMFSAPLSGGPAATLLGWFAGLCPAVLGAAGPDREGGLLHRLDFETEGLVLFAKTPEALAALRAQQAAGLFVKEYSALAFAPAPRGPDAGESPPRGPAGLPGFPPPPFTGPFFPAPPLSVESFFRPWGPGRKAVRPVSGDPLRSPERGGRDIARDRGAPYRTEILAARDCPGPRGDRRFFTRVFALRIRRGFRHQIRCHLAWIGTPILNDALYGGKRCPEDCPARGGAPGPEGGEKRPIALRARAFHFIDPSTGERQNYRLPGFAEDPGIRADPGFREGPGFRG
jgi:23S rRNA pseudouridine1911/1915/1917 synthase